MQYAGAARQAEEQKKKNREIILKLMGSIYFLANRIPHSTTYMELLELQVFNSDELLEKHLSEGPSNAQYMSRFSAIVLIEAIDIWIEGNLCVVSKRVPFSIFADELQDISIYPRRAIHL